MYRALAVKTFCTSSWQWTSFVTMREKNKRVIRHNEKTTDFSWLLLFAAITVTGYYSGGTEACKSTINASKGMSNLACFSMWISSKNGGGKVSS